MKSHDEEMAAVAACVAPWAERAIRRDERFKLATLLEEHADALTSFTNDDSNTLSLVAFLLRLRGDDPA